MLRSLRNGFLTGLVTLLPLGITVFIVRFLIQHIGTPTSKLFFGQFHLYNRDHLFIAFIIDLIATLFVVLIITVLGWISTYFFGKIIIRAAEKVIEKLPFVRTLYRTSKQIIGTFAENQRAVFQESVLVEFPRKGIYSLGFVTGEMKGEIQCKTKDTVVSVFVPTTPNPTSGFLLFLPKSELTALEMSVSDSLKAVISGGVFVPAYDGSSIGLSPEGEGTDRESCPECSPRPSEE